MIIMDTLVINEKNELEGYTCKADMKDNKRQFFDTRNDTFGVYFELYKTGELEKLAEYAKTVNENDDRGAYIQIYFILDSNKLSAKRKAKFAEKYPLNHVSKLDSEKYTPCCYTDCVTLGYTRTGLGMATYRDVYGSIGRSWESPFVQGFHYPDVAEFAKIRNESGAVQAGIACFEKMFSGTGMTSEEYDKLVYDMYEE